MQTDQEIRVIVFKEGDMLVAQCLEYDICTQGPDIETLRQRMDCLLELELENGQAIDPGPVGYHIMWERAQSIPDGPQYRMVA